MIAFVSGTVKFIRKETVVLDVHSVGYEVYIGNPELCKIGEELFLFTYQHVREDAILLFGFKKEEDYEVFMRLINVKGIGPKTALNLLAVCPASQMVEAIESDDVKRLKSLPGIGAKTASQIVLDLKGKFVSVETKSQKSDNPIWNECEEALVSLGYKPQQLSTVKKELIKETNMSVDQMLRKALGIIAKRNGV